MTPREFRTLVVEPNLLAFAANPADLRHAMNAVHSVDALAARIHYGSGGATGWRDDLEYRDKLAQADPEFALLRDVAKAIKHADLRRGTPKVSGAGQITSQTIGWDQAVWGELEWDAPSRVVVEMTGGPFRNLEKVVGNALALLDREMARLGL